MVISLLLKNVCVLIGKVLNKTKTNIFSTVGLQGLLRPFLLLRTRKTDVRREPSDMYCVRKVTLTHLGAEISVTRKVCSHSHSNRIPSMDNQLFHSMTVSHVTSFKVQKSPWIVPVFENWLTAPRTKPPYSFDKIWDNVFCNGCGRWGTSVINF